MKQKMKLKINMKHFETNIMNDVGDVANFMMEGNQFLKELAIMS